MQVSIHLAAAIQHVCRSDVIGPWVCVLVHSPFLLHANTTGTKRPTPASRSTEASAPVAPCRSPTAAALAPLAPPARTARSAPCLALQPPHTHTHTLTPISTGTPARAEPEEHGLLLRVDHGPLPPGYPEVPAGPWPDPRPEQVPVPGQHCPVLVSAPLACFTLVCRRRHALDAPTPPPPPCRAGLWVWSPSLAPHESPLTDTTRCR